MPNLQPIFSKVLVPWIREMGVLELEMQLYETNQFKNRREDSYFLNSDMLNVKIESK